MVFLIYTAYQPDSVFMHQLLPYIWFVKGFLHKEFGVTKSRA